MFRNILIHPTNAIVKSGAIFKPKPFVLKMQMHFFAFRLVTKCPILRFYLSSANLTVTLAFVFKGPMQCRFWTRLLYHDRAEQSQ